VVTVAPWSQSVVTVGGSGTPTGAVNYKLDFASGMILALTADIILPGSQMALLASAIAYIHSFQSSPDFPLIEIPENCQLTVSVAQGPLTTSQGRNFMKISTKKTTVGQDPLSTFTFRGQLPRGGVAMQSKLRRTVPHPGGGGGGRPHRDVPTTSVGQAGAPRRGGGPTVTLTLTLT